MSQGHVRSSIRFVCIGLFVALASFLVACGSDDSTQKLTVTLQKSGKDSSFTAPKEADSGPAEIELINDGEKEIELQMLRVEGKPADQEVADNLKKAIEGKRLRAWFSAGGGVGQVAPGQSVTITQVLQPGTYYLYNAEAGTVKSKITVNGEESDAQLEADTTVKAVDYGFETSALPAGENEILFENAGAQPHHLLAAPLLGDSTAEDVERYFKAEKGKAPLDQKSTQSTAVIEGGESQLVTLDLEPGRYVLYCFVSDRQGGPPHALKGMVDEVEVE